MSLFSLSSTGELTFNTAPDYENPSGTGGDNDYEVIVTATDDATLPLPSGLMGSMTTTQTLTITVTDENDNAPVFSSSETENVAEGTTAVITVTATDADADAGQTVSYTLTGGEDASNFSITPTGALRFTAMPDYEVPTDIGRDNIYEVIVTASDRQTPPMTATQTLTITVTDVNDNAPEFTSSATEDVAEGTTAVTTVTATDADAGQTVTFTLSGDDEGLFSITMAGALTFKTAPDYETPGSASGSNIYTVTVTATDDGQSPTPLTTMQTLTITVTDENDNAPDFTSSATEDVVEGTTAVITVTATDADAGQTVRYTLTGGTDMGLFSITSTGKLTFTNAPDYELPADMGTDNLYEVIVTASDGQPSPMTATQTLTITVTDENEAPTATDATFSPAENSATGAVVGVVVGTDEDQTSPNNALTYAITDGNTGGAFAINSTTGEMTVAATLDFETTASYSLEVTVTDGGSTPLSGTATLTITVTDENEAPTASDTTFSVVETTASGTEVGTVTATDPDQTSPDNTLTYTITSGNTGDVFAIDETTGAITVAGALDYAITVSYSLVVTVADGGSPSLRGAATLTIMVTDVNDAPTVSDTTFVVAENSANGIVVGSVVGTDPDQTSPNNVLTYAITDGNTGDVFAINETTGEITVAGVLDYATTASYSLEVTVTDGGSPSPLSDMATLTITVTDVNEAPTVSDTTFVVAENSATGIVVGSVVGTDPDQTSPNNVLTYAITGGNTGDVFAISETTGEITVAGALDYETTASYSLEVTVTDDGSIPLSGTATLAITVADENEAPTASDDAFSVAETGANGTVVGTVVGTDPDQTSPNNVLTYVITGGNTGDVFAINETTGEITVAGALDYETTASYSLEVIVTDGGSTPLSGTAMLTITVTDEDEPLGLEAFTGISVYPNPAGAVLHISGVEGTARYTLSGMDGKIVKRGKLKAGKGDHSVTIPSLGKGIYLLQIITGKGSVTKKIVKE